MSAKSCLTSFDFFGPQQSVFLLMTVGKGKGRSGVEWGHAPGVCGVMLEWFFATPVKASSRGRGPKCKMFAKTPFRAPHCCLLVKPSFPTMWGTDKNGKRMRDCQLTSFRHWATFEMGHLSWFVQGFSFIVVIQVLFGLSLSLTRMLILMLEALWFAILPTIFLSACLWITYAWGWSVCLLEWIEAVQPRLMLQLLWIVHSSGRFPQYSFGLPPGTSPLNYVRWAFRRAFSFFVALLVFSHRLGSFLSGCSFRIHSALEM